MSGAEIRDLIRWLTAQLPPPTKKKVTERFGVDYAWGNVSPRNLHRIGASFVGRYISTPGNTKNLRKSEARALHASGIDILIFFETTADRALDGFAAGHEDAHSAEQQLRALGAPPDQPVYFTVDIDETPQQAPIVANYFRGLASVLGHSRTGVYGGYWTCKRLLDARLVHYACQTFAWSGGAWDLRAHVRQYSVDQTLAGVSVDFLRATTDGFGAWKH